MAELAAREDDARPESAAKDTSTGRPLSASTNLMMGTRAVSTRSRASTRHADLSSAVPSLRIAPTTADRFVSSTASTTSRSTSLLGRYSHADDVDEPVDPKARTFAPGHIDATRARARSTIAARQARSARVGLNAA